MVVAAAYRAVWDRLPGSTAWKIGLSAGVLTMTPLAAPPDPIYPLRSSRREQVADRRPARCTAALSVTTVWLGRSDWSCRDTRQWAKRFGSGPIGGGGDSPVMHRAPGYRHDCAQSRGSHQPPPSSSVRARTSRFSAATTRSEVPATPLSLRLGGPVSQPLANAWGQTTPPRRSAWPTEDEHAESEQH